MAKNTQHEDELARQLELAKIPYSREYVAIDGRRFRWDFWIKCPASTDILAEVQGGIWIKGGHSTGTGITKDCEKQNLAAINYFRTMAFTPDQIKTGQALRWIQEAV